MARKKAGGVPGLQFHKRSGQGRVHLSGRDFYCGKWGTAACKAKYDRLIAEWLNNGRTVLPPTRQSSATPLARPSGQPQQLDPSLPLPAMVEQVVVDPTGGRDKEGYSTYPAGSLLICEVAALYLKHAAVYYRDGFQNPTTTQGNVKQALVALEPYDDLPAAAFGPRKLQEMRALLIQQGRPRKSCNTITKAVKRLFAWAESQELVPAGTSHALATVDPLKFGRTTAPERPPVKPVPDEIIDRTVEHLPRVVADMVRLQRLTGARSSEVCDMRPCDIDRSGDVWEYRPRRHKTQYREGHEVKVIPLGPKAQAILLPYLDRLPELPCFSPRESELERHAEMRRQRKSPVQPSQKSRRKRRPQRQPGDQYDRNSYRRAIQRAAKKAGVAEWTPHQIRHTAATDVRRRFGLEAAQTSLGHRSADVTQLYAERNLELARKVAAEIG